MGVEHAVGVYIVLVGIACIVGILTKWLAHLPYTIALTLVGLVLAFFEIGPQIGETGFSEAVGKELIFFVLLPPILFQGAFHMQLDRLRRHAVSVGIFATIGVVATMLIIGGITYGLNAFDSIMIAMLFGALICATDPVSVLALFRRYEVPADLKYLIEGESLFNDGTGVVVFGIVLTMITSGEGFDTWHGLSKFFEVSVGGAFIGLGAGLATYLVLRRLHDHLLENTICLVACYSSFWLAEHWHLSGVIAVVCTGLLLGNYGRGLAMNPKTTETVETFFESIAFLINSLIFILIGLELSAIPGRLWDHSLPIAIGIMAVLVGRLLVIYPLFFATRGIGGGYPAKWAHILFWGGLRGSIPIALLLGLPHDPAVEPYRATLLAVGFGVVCFSLIVQGLTMKPLILALKLAPAEEELEVEPAYHQDGLV